MKELITKTKVNSKIVIGGIVLIILVGLSFVGASLLSTGVTFVNTNTNDNSKYNPCKAHNSPNDLIAWYQFNGDANDASGNNFSGLIYGNESDPTQPQANPIFINTALMFDGINDYVAIPLQYCGNQHQINKITACAWFNSQETTGGNFDNWALVDFDRNQYFSLFVTPDGRVGFSTHSQIDNNSINDLYTNNLSGLEGPSLPFNDNYPHLVCAVYNQGNKKIYVDGYLFGQTSAHNGRPLSGNVSRFGMIGDGSQATSFNGTRSNKYYKGLIDEVRIYERALSQDEVLNLNMQKYTEIIQRCIVNNASTSYINMPDSCLAEINAIPDSFFIQEQKSIKPTLATAFSNGAKSTTVQLTKDSAEIKQGPLQPILQYVSPNFWGTVNQKSTPPQTKWMTYCIPKVTKFCNGLPDGGLKDFCLGNVNNMCLNWTGLCTGNPFMASYKVCLLDDPTNTAWCPFDADCVAEPPPYHSRGCGCINFEPEDTQFRQAITGDNLHYCAAYLNASPPAGLTVTTQGSEFLCKVKGVHPPACAFVGTWPHGGRTGVNAIDIFFSSCTNPKQTAWNWMDFLGYYFRMTILDEMVYSWGDTGHLHIDTSRRGHYPDPETLNPKRNEPCFKRYKNTTSGLVPTPNGPPCSNSATYP